MAFSFFLYNFVLFSSTGLLFLSEKVRSKPQKRFCYLISYLITALSVGLSFELGMDYLNYQNYFLEIAHTDILRMEPGYYAINWLVSFLGGDFNTLYAVVALLTWGFIYLAYPKKNGFILHFILMAVIYFKTYNLLRQMLAFSICFYAYMEFSQKEKAFSYMKKVVSSLLFHVSV